MVTTVSTASSQAHVTRLHASFERSDTGNAERLVATYGEEIRWEATSRQWLVWTGQMWAADMTGEVMRRAIASGRQLVQEASEVASGDTRRDALRHATRSLDTGKLRACLEVARVLPGMTVTHEDLDADPWILNTLSGIVDLRTGRTRPPDRRALCTRLVPARCDPNATAPAWAAFLQQVLPDPQVRRFFQRLAGYSLTAVATEQILPVLYGPGANGKSTAVEVLRDLLGDYATTVPPDLLVQRRDATAQPHGLVRLRGARLATASETEDGARLSVALVKSLTGGDTVTARYLYGEFFDFRLNATIILSTNHRPVIKDSTESIWRRLRLVPFTVVIPAERRDHRLGETLRGELDGILTWAVQGCLDWQRGGLTNPQAITAATSEYRADSDLLGAFLGERTTTGPQVWVTARDLWATWTSWASDRGENPGTQTALARHLSDRGHISGRGTGGTRLWRGLALTQPGENT